MLLSNDLLILELQKLTLFLKVSDDLPETFLEQLNFGLQKLDLLVLFKLFLSMLFHCHAFLAKLSHGLLVVQLQLSVFVV